MLYTCDGNDSLKRIICREYAQEVHEPDPMAPDRPVLAPSSESIDTRAAGQDMFLTTEMVDRWSNEILKDKVAGYQEDPDDDNPCAPRWRNMKSEITAKMWGIFEETGLFLALCRHGFVLLLADMVRSGEL